MRPRTHLLTLFTITVIVVGALIAVLVSILGQPDTTIILTQQFRSQTGVNFDYPEHWQSVIPERNIIFLADPAVLNQQPGASMTIQRSLRLTTEVDTLEAALERYVQRGPLAAAGEWTLTGEIRATQIDGRDARSVSLEGSEFADAPPMRSQISVTAADNGIFYIFAMSAPRSGWDAVEPTFVAILDSVNIQE